MIRFAVIGCGSAGRRRVADLAARDGIAVAALCDSSRETRAALAAAHPRALVTDDADRAIAEADCVVVATPPSLHAGAARAALAAGRHVLVEKPLAVALDDARALARLAREKDLALRTAANHRWFPPVAEGARLIAAGAIGRVRRLRLRIGHDGRRLPPWARDVRLAGGGALLDNGVHLADLACYWLPSLAGRVTASAAGDFSTEIEPAAGGRLAFADGPLVELWASWRVRGDYLVAAADGTAGALYLRVGRATSLEVRGASPTAREWDGAPFRAWERDLDGFLDEVRGRAPRRAVDGVRPLALVDALYRAARARAPVETELPLTGPSAPPSFGGAP